MYKEMTVQMDLSLLNCYHVCLMQTKSTYTVDARSEYGGAGGGLLPLWEDDPIKGIQL